MRRLQRFPAGRSSLVRTLALALSAAIAVELLLAVHRPAAAELKEPQASDRQVTLVVGSLLRREHITRRSLDDESSRRGLKLFLETLDPMKLYFYQSDVAEFTARQDDLDDQLKKGDITFAYAVYNRLLARIDERVKTIDELLAMKHDFTVDEEIVIDPESVDYPANAEEARERWRKRIKYDLLSLKADKKSELEAKDRLVRRYHGIAKRMHQTDSDELLEMYLTSFTSAFDPHTNYMSPSNLENFYIQMKLNLEGIGAALKVEDSYTVVTKVIPGGAADKHGKLKVEDRIVSVGQGEGGDMVDVVDMKLNDVVKLIRGKAGTVVRLGVIPNGATETRIYNITRATVELKDSEARGVIFDEGRKPDGRPYRIGVIDLPSFYMDMGGARRGVADFKSTTRDVRKILDDFNAKGVDAVVLDLRMNGGGSLPEAINLTGLFLDQGPIVQVKDADGRIQHLDDLDRGVAWAGPLVVLTSKFSASASEIFAGAIQDYHRGIIVGDDTTHGKGTVQSLLDLGSQLFRVPEPPNLGALKITMQQFYRPNGDSTQKRGVVSDVTLPSITNHIKDVAEADLKFALEFDRVPAAQFTRYNLISRDIVAELRSRSSTRVKDSPDFDKAQARIRNYLESKERKTRTLNEAKFLAERAEFDADREDERQFEEQENPQGETIKRDYFVNETLAITADYILLLQNHKIAASPAEKPAG
jgi:carboxyl-terminal processing protease